MPRPIKDYVGTTVNGWTALARVQTPDGKSQIRATKSIAGVSFTEDFHISAWTSGRVMESPERRRNYRNYVVVYTDTDEAKLVSLLNTLDPAEALKTDRPILIYRISRSFIQLVHSGNKRPAFEFHLPEPEQEQEQQEQEQRPTPSSMPELPIPIVDDDDWNQFTPRKDVVQTHEMRDDGCTYDLETGLMTADEHGNPVNGNQ